MAGFVSGAVLRYLGSSWLRNVYSSVLGGLNMPFSQRHDQWAEKSKSWEAGPCFSLAHHQPPEETWASSPDFSTTYCPLLLGPFFSQLGNY